MRGKKRFDFIGADLFGGVDTPRDGRKPGRDAGLIDDRNALLVARLYYYRTFTKYRNEYIMERLSREFFLKPVTIPQVLELLDVELAKIKKEQPTIKQLRERYDWWVWELE